MQYIKLSLFIVIAGLLSFGLALGEPVSSGISINHAPATTSSKSPPTTITNPIAEALAQETQIAKQKYGAAVRVIAALLDERIILGKQRTAQADILRAELKNRDKSDLTPEQREQIESNLAAAYKKLEEIRSEVAAKTAEMETAKKEKNTLKGGFEELMASESYLTKLFDDYTKSQDEMNKLQGQESGLKAAVNKIKEQLSDVINKIQDFVIIDDTTYKISGLLKDPDILSEMKSEPYSILAGKIAQYQTEADLLPGYERLVVTSKKSYGFLKGFYPAPTPEQEEKIAVAKNQFDLDQKRYQDALAMKGEIEQDIRTATFDSTLRSLSTLQAIAVQKLYENRVEQAAHAASSKSIEAEVSFVNTTNTRLEEMTPLTEAEIKSEFPKATLAGSDRSILLSYDTFREEFIGLVKAFMAKKLTADSNDDAQMDMAATEKQFEAMQKFITTLRTNLDNPPNKDSMLVSFGKWLKKFVTGTRTTSRLASEAISSSVNDMASSAETLLNEITQYSKNSKLQTSILNAQTEVDSLNHSANYYLGNIKTTKDSDWFKELLKSSGVDLTDADAIKKLTAKLESQKGELSYVVYSQRDGDLLELSKESYYQSLAIQTEEISTQLENRQKITLQGATKNEEVSRLVRSIDGYNDALRATIKPSPVTNPKDPTTDPIHTGTITVKPAPVVVDPDAPGAPGEPGEPIELPWPPEPEPIIIEPDE